MTQEALKLALEALENNKLNHLYCEDTWYSCPKHEDGCANEAEGDECNCGADEVNAQFDNAITAIKEALAQPEQEPMATWENHYGMKEWQVHALRAGWSITPPQRTWVGLTDNEIDQGLLRSDYAFKTAEAWRAGVVFAMTKLKEKNT